MPQLRIALFGRCDVTLDGERVGPSLSPSAQALLAYLAANRESPFSRQTLTAFLWPDETDYLADDSLQTSVTEIQSLLNQRIYDAPPFLLANRENVILNPASSITVDTATFENHLYAVAQHQHRRIDACPQCVQRLIRASALYSASFLRELEIKSQPFIAWQIERRNYYQTQVLEIHDTLVSHYQLVEDYEKVAYYARKQLAIDPWMQTGHIHLLEALLSLGELGAASAHFESVRHQYALAADVDLPQPIIDVYEGVRIPRPQSTVIASSIGLPGDGDSKQVSSLSEDKAHYIVPKIGMSIIGREAELLQLSDWLSEDTKKCIILTGIGGVGKTHLALATAEATRGAFRHGVVYVGLTGIEFSGRDESIQTEPGPLPSYTTNSENLLHILFDKLHLSIDPETPEDQQFYQELNDREMLLVMDNAEHYQESIKRFITDISNVAPLITLLICSRYHIEIDGPQILEISPLPVPQQTNSALAADYASVRLFAACAQQQHPDFTLSREILPAVIEICQQVEGLPLSIALAATWIPKFNVSQIADAVKRDLSVLVATSSVIPERHRSLQVVFEGSWRLLSVSEQSVLRQSAVFRGGFDQKAATAIFQGETCLEETLSVLVKNGFLVEHDQERYDLPRIVRQYVMTKAVMLDEDTDGDAVSFRHAAYYLDPDKWQKRTVGLDRDSHNVRHAWQWAAAKGDLTFFSPGLMGWIWFLEKWGRFQEGSSASELLIWRLKYRDDLDAKQPGIQNMIGQLYVARGGFLTMLGKYTEASEVIQYALNLALVAKDATLEAAIQLAWGTLMWRQGDYPAAQTRITQALQQAQELKNVEITQQCLYQLGSITMHQSDYSVAQMYLLQSLDLSKIRKDGYHEGQVLNALGFLSQSLGDYAIARVYLQDALQRFEKSGSLWGKGTAQQNLGYVAHRLGEYDEARTWYEQALFTNRECANRYAEAKTLASLGLLFFHQGDFEATHKACRQAYDFSRQLGDRATEAEVLTVWGHAYAGQKEVIEAAAAYQKALDLRQELGQRDGSTEATAGLVRLALMEGAGVHAMPFVEKILDRIRLAENLKGAGEPLRIYLTCYDALVENQDPRAGQVLDRAYHLLMAQADSLENLALRKSLLSNVEVHREIVKLYENQ